MAKIKFQRTSAPTGSVEFSRNPSIVNRGMQRKRKYFQPKDFSDSGDLYIYDKGVAKNYITLTWSNIPKTDYDNFIAFLAVVVGSKYNFTFTDFDGATYTARINNAEDIQSAPVMTGRESLASVELLIE
ncbi:MAG: hypothetical protein HZB37_05520 [Planctomycetes bacterium]|nr:hypothetical protein [Planctomycetota bacterium]